VQLAEHQLIELVALVQQHPQHLERRDRDIALPLVEDVEGVAGLEVERRAVEGLIHDRGCSRSR
jgi:hypothetical protein